MNEQTMLLETAENRLRRLSLARLRVAADFLAYLEEREESDATEELLSIPGFTGAFDCAVLQVNTGDIVRLEQSAELYAELYEEDSDLQELTEAALPLFVAKAPGANSQKEDTISQ